MVNDIKKIMVHGFKMTDLELLHYFLALKVNKKLGIILVSQKRFVEALLRKFGMINRKHQSTPLNVDEKLQLEDNSGRTDKICF